MSVVCSCCKVSVEKHLAVVCSVCKSIHKHSCVGLSQAEVRSINSKSKNLSWCCVNCNALGNDLNSLKAAILSLQNEVRQLKDSEKNVASTVAFESILEEFEDRQRRKCNLIVFGIPEQDSALDRNSRVESEKSTITDILHQVSPEANISANSKVIRLGKFSPNLSKPRPICVQLQSSHMVHDVIHKIAPIKKSNRALKNVSVSFDRTPKQIEHLKSLKTELEERRMSGEDNLKIKYIRNYPKIVSEN